MTQGPAAACVPLRQCSQKVVAGEDYFDLMCCGRWMDLVGVGLRHAAMGQGDREDGAELVGALEVVLNIGLAIALGVVYHVSVVCLVGFS